MVERRAEEFWCDPSGGGCGKYFQTFLRENLNGAYTIQCPNDGLDAKGKRMSKECLHQHYRLIRNGLVTSDRDYAAKTQGHIILGLKATLRDTPWHNSPEHRRSLLKKV